ncbi:MAG: hypothetical protein ACLUUO_15265 [Sellimonas intestinalis]
MRLGACLSIIVDRDFEDLAYSMKDENYRWMRWDEDKEKSKGLESKYWLLIIVAACILCMAATFCGC